MRQLKALAALEMGAAETEYERAKQDAEKATRTFQNYGLKVLYEEEYVARQKAINDRLVALEAKDARIRTDSAPGAASVNAASQIPTSTSSARLFLKPSPKSRLKTLSLARTPVL